LQLPLDQEVVGLRVALCPVLSPCIGINIIYVGFINEYHLLYPQDHFLCPWPFDTRRAAFTTPNEVLCVPIVSHVSTSGTVDSRLCHYCEVLRFVLLAHIVLRLEFAFTAWVPTYWRFFIFTCRTYYSYIAWDDAGHHGHILMTERPTI